MFKRILTSMIIAAAMSLATVSAGEMTLLEEAAEFDRLTARVTSDGRGYLEVRRCDECEAVKLRITPGTELEVNARSRPLRELNDGALSAGTVFYDPDNLTVLRISGSR